MLVRVYTVANLEPQIVWLNSLILPADLHSAADMLVSHYTWKWKLTPDKTLTEIRYVITPSLIIFNWAHIVKLDELSSKHHKTITTEEYEAQQK